jgi:hypothetical protein
MIYPENIVAAAIAAEDLEDKETCEYIAQMGLNAGGANSIWIEDRVKFYKKYKREILEVIFDEYCECSSEEFNKMLCRICGEKIPNSAFSEIFIFENTDYVKYGQVISYLVDVVFQDIASQLLDDLEEEKEHN